MERSGHTTPGVRPADLLALLEGTGPFATVWISTPLGIGDQDPLIPAWTAASGRLAGDGVPAPVIEQLGAAVAERRHDGAGLVVVADEDGVRLAEPLPDPPRAELTRWARLPSLSAVLEHRQSLIPYVVVLLDRRGAELFAGVPEHHDLVAEAGGHDDPLTKSAPGGWSQSRYQQRAENTWERNAGEVAERLVELVERTDPSLVVVAGDVRAKQLLVDAVPEAVRRRLHEAPGGRAADGSDEQRAEAVERLVRTAVAADTVEVLHAFERELGQHDRAADGPARTLEALRARQVDVLLVHDDPDDDRTAFIGPEPEHIAVDRATVEALGVDEPVEARLVDAAIRAALHAGSSVRVVPAATPPRDGLGAVLRWG